MDGARSLTFGPPDGSIIIWKRSGLWQAAGTLKRYPVVSVCPMLPLFSSKHRASKPFYAERGGMEFTFNGEHCWEAGTKNTPVKAVRSDIESIFTVINNFYAPEKPRHLIFVCGWKNA